MVIYDICYYQRPSGRCPVREEIDGLDTRDVATIDQAIRRFLRDSRYHSKTNRVEWMKGTKHKIGEFKVNITNGWFRVFFWPYGRVLWLVLAYVKKDNKTDRNKLDTCDDIIDDLRERLGVS